MIIFFFVKIAYEKNDNDVDLSSLRLIFNRGEIDEEGII